MTISIDLDKTWTADPLCFALLAYTFKARGHTVIICTRRSELSHEERIALQIPEFVTIFFASYGFKRDAVPFPVDIWIDDEPGTIEPQRLLQEPDRLPEGWKFEYVHALGCNCLFDPSNKLVYKDITATASLKHLISLTY